MDWCGGLVRGISWGGRSVHADGGGGDMADEFGGQWGECLLAVFVSGANQFLTDS
jgi:hypothetical protein